jgi:hypothetical protein
MMEHKLTPLNQDVPRISLTIFTATELILFDSEIGHTSFLRVCRHFRNSDGLNVHGAKFIESNISTS